jgi:hypothetical protein
VQNAAIPCRSQKLLPFYYVIGYTLSNRTIGNVFSEESIGTNTLCPLQDFICIVQTFMLDQIINIFFYQLEVIGGADKYMAVCRMCHRTPVVPRSPLKQIDNQITKSMERSYEKSHGVSF